MFVVHGASVTRVVHVRDILEELDAPDVVYIGRQMPPWATTKRRPFPKSKWCNGFKVENGNRRAAVEAYAEWLMTQPELLASLPELKGKRLACWCHPLRCHGEVLADMAEWAS